MVELLFIYFLHVFKRLSYYTLMPVLFSETTIHGNLELSKKMSMRTDEMEGTSV